MEHFHRQATPSSDRWVMAAMVGLPAVGYLISPATKKQESEAWIPAGEVDSYPIGVPTLFSFTRTKINGWEKTVNSHGVYILRKSEAENDILTLSNVCTHLSCRVSWDEETQVYPCPCHDAHFDINGLVIDGPPPLRARSTASPAIRQTSSTSLPSPPSPSMPCTAAS